MILGQSVTPCEGEVSIKSYLCTQFNSKIFGIKADGYLEVTNKRLLFQALGKSRSEWSVIHNEVAIADVSEVKIYKGSSFNIIQFIMGVILSLIVGVIFKAGLSFSGSSGLGTFLALAVIAGGIYWFYINSKTNAFSLIINTKGGSGNVVYIAGTSPFGNSNSIAAKALQALPARDSELVCKEIGAVVLDIQKLGENAIEKWRK
jgi:hypothetical protein